MSDFETISDDSPQQRNEPVRHVAIVGSGPAGFYAAEALANAEQPVEIDIIDRLPTPYGLVRAGVAPDHQSMKKVIKRYEKAALRENVEFFGNIHVGDEVSLAELKGLYDAVILATGAPEDRRLPIPGGDKFGVLGSGEFVGWFNSHPDFVDLKLDLNVTSVAVIGNGNVAIDVARVLAKSPEEMRESDLADYAAKQIHNAPLKDIWMFGRRGPMEASFTPRELGELGQLEQCSALADARQLPAEAYADSEKELPAKAKILDHLKSFAENVPRKKPMDLHLLFYSMPVEILGGNRVEGLRLEKTEVIEGRAVGTGETFEIPCGLVVTCIGYRSLPIEGAPFDERRGKIPNEGGFVEDNLYVVGWIRRGPTGTIGTNRPDAQEVVSRILEKPPAGDKTGRKELVRILQDRGLQFISFAAWKRIEEAEEAAAKGLAPRVKFTHIEEMLAAAKSIMS